MSEFSLKEYRKNPKNTKEKVFIQFLYERFGGLPTDSEEFDNKYFTLLDEGHLIESLEYYISRNRVTKQSTADSYITYISQFFDMLSNDYYIKSEIFQNKEVNRNFITKSKEIIAKLREAESKGVADDQQYEDLNNHIDKYLKTLSIQDIYDEINKFKDVAYNEKTIYFNIYHRFVSIITIKLVMKFALSNLTITSLKTTNLDMENKVLKVKIFKLPLDKELIELLTNYLEIREYVLNIQSKQQNILFIKPDGEPYITISNKPDCTRLFKIMNDELGNVATDLFVSRRILEMLDKGLDISSVIELSERSDKKCIELQKNYLSDAGDRLQHFFKEEDIDVINEPKNKKGYLNCPFCGKEVKPISEEWILVQLNENGSKHLSCRECKGNNGKYRL